MQVKIPFHTKLALPYFPLLALAFLILISLNIGFLDCQGLQFTKTDIDNYLMMFEARDSDIAHRFYVLQINGISDITGWDYMHTVFYTSFWKAFLIFPIIFFLFFCSLGQNIGRSGLAVVLLYSFSWWIPMHLILGLHAQFDSMMFFFLFATAANLRRQTNGIELDLVYWGSMFMAIISHFYVLVVLWIYFMFYGSHKKIVFASGLVIVYILGLLEGYPLSVYLGMDQKVSVFTMLMIGSILWFGEYRDSTSTDRKYIIVLAIFGLLSDNHRLFLYALPYLAYHFAIRYEQYGIPYQVILFFGALYYNYLTLIFWITNMRAEIPIDRKIDYVCFDLLTT